MNPIIRMMKRYIKTPLKYALPLLFIGSLVLVATTGCVTLGNAGVDVIINSKKVGNQLGSGDLISTPSPGHQYLIFNVTVKNLNKQDANIGNPNYFKLIMSDGFVYEYASSSHPLLDNAIQSASHTSPGDNVTGQIAFEIPHSATPSKLQYNDYSNKVMVKIDGVSLATGNSAGTLSDWRAYNLNNIQSDTGYALISSEDATIANHPVHMVV